MAITLDFLDRNLIDDKSISFNYSDISLDFELDSDISNTPVNRVSNKRDIRLLYDEDSIFQSIRNIFNTRPGEKILDPTFGLDLSQFLFLPINEDTGQLIGDTIKNKLPIYEPRISVNNVDIVGRPSSNEYFIEFSITIPTLNNNNQIVKGTLDLEGFKYE